MLGKYQPHFSLLYNFCHDLTRKKFQSFFVETYKYIYVYRYICMQVLYTLLTIYNIQEILYLLTFLFIFGCSCLKKKEKAAVKIRISYLYNVFSCPRSICSYTKKNGKHEQPKTPANRKKASQSFNYAKRVLVRPFETVFHHSDFSGTAFISFFFVWKQQKLI